MPRCKHGYSDCEYQNYDDCEECEKGEAYYPDPDDPPWYSCNVIKKEDTSHLRKRRQTKNNLARYVMENNWRRFDW